MVLQSSMTCQREDALEAQNMLADILRCPADAADRLASCLLTNLEACHTDLSYSDWHYLSGPFHRKVRASRPHGLRLLLPVRRPVKPCVKVL